MKLNKRRRIENKTNYNKRLKLLNSNSIRLVIRKTNKYVILQLIKSVHAQDSVISSVNTKELLEYGWPKDKQGSLKCLTASYLGGFLLGKKNSKLKERIILDSGLTPSTKGSRIYACVKGISDSGISINYDGEIAPSEDQIKGDKEKIMKEVLKNLDSFKEIKDKPEKIIKKK